MLSRSRHLLSCSVVVGILVNAERPCAAEPVGESRTMSETALANLRAGAGVGHGFQLIVIGSDPRTIEKAPGEWFLLAAADDGHDGYVPERFAKLVENAPTPTAPAGPAIAKNEKAPARAAGAAPVQAARAEPADGKSPSILQLLEIHEKEVKIALVVAGVAFVLGWVCGGFYSVRRERKYRRRLRL